MTVQQKVFTPRLLVSLLLAVVLLPFLPLLISWQWGWWQAWVYALVSIGGLIISRVLAGRRHPDLLVERAQSMQHADTQTWDKVLAPLSWLGGGLILLVAGLDARFSWSPPFGGGLNWLAILILLATYVLGTFALLENRFFSGTVRIQSDRNHQVVSTGPYAWVRHPGYAGAILTYLATPLLLDSSWAFVPTVFVCLALIYRTVLEDRFLQAELAGYAAYAQRVRWRLVPGLW